LLRLSIVIPVPENGIQQLEETLLSVLENRPESCEVIVVHSGCYHDPYALGDEVRFVESAGKATFVQLADLGIGAAQSDIVHLLSSGVLVEEGWVEPVLAHFDDPAVSCVAPVVFSGPDKGRIAAAGVAYGVGGRRVVLGHGRRFRLGYQPPRQMIGPTLAAAFYRTSALAAAGGLSEVVGSQFADLDMALTLHLMGYQAAFEPACHVQAATTLITPEVGALAGGWGAERCFWRHATVQSWLQILVAHPLWMIAEGLADLVRLRMPRAVGRLAALCCAVRDLRHLDAVMRSNQDRRRQAAHSPGNLDTPPHDPICSEQVTFPGQDDPPEESTRRHGLKRAG